MIQIPTTKPRRLGVEAARALIKKPVDEWERIEGYYNEMLKAKGGNHLVALQRTIDDLTSRFRNASVDKDGEVFITKDEFISVMKWKFSIGKDRTNLLMKGLQENSELSIQKAVSKTIYTLESEINLKDALTEITVLNKVGPAAGSIFLSMKSPRSCCFLADEVVESVNPSGKLEYTPKVFFSVAEACKCIAYKLGEEWTAARVGKTLWTAAMLSCYNISAKQMQGIENSNKSDTVLRNVTKRQSLSLTTRSRGKRRKA